MNQLKHYSRKITPNLTNCEFLSAGFPSELFYKGSAMWETLYGMLLAYPIVCFVFVPVYYSLGITSVYQYLDLRFKSRLVRCLASGTYVVRQLLNQGVTVFTPCVALNTVIGIPYYASICGITAVSIIFTLLVSYTLFYFAAHKNLRMIFVCYVMNHHVSVIALRWTLFITVNIYIVTLLVRSEFKFYA